MNIGVNLYIQQIEDFEKSIFNTVPVTKMKLYWCYMIVTCYILEVEEN